MDVPDAATTVYLIVLWNYPDQAAGMPSHPAVGDAASALGVSM